MGSEERDPAARLADHAAIDALTDELIPALIAKLGASGLGEIEVREGGWKVRLRRPADGAPGPQGRRAGRSAAPAPPARSTLTPVGPGRGPNQAGDDGEATRQPTSAPTGLDGDGARSAVTTGAGRDPFRAIATSPAVGFFQPRSGVVPGPPTPEIASAVTRSSMSSRSMSRRGGCPLAGSVTRTRPSFARRAPDRGFGRDDA